MKTALRFILKPTVPVFQINGIITQKTVDQIEHQLKDTTISSARAVAIVINSPGGSPTAGQKIINKIKYFAEEHHLPVYAFAEDLAASAGYQILISGSKVYADEQSLVGSIGSVSNIISIKKVVENQGIELRRISTNKALVSNQSILNDVPKELRAVYEEQVQKQQQNFIYEVEAARGNKIKVEVANRKAQIYNGDVFSGKQALDYGLVDSIGCLQEVIAKDFPKAQLVFQKATPQIGKVEEISKLYNLFQSLFKK